MAEYMNVNKIISHTIRPLNYKNVCLQEIYLYIDLLKKANIPHINFNMSMIAKITQDCTKWKDLAINIKNYTDSLNMDIPITHAVYESALIISSYNGDLLKKTETCLDIATNIFKSKIMVIHSGIGVINNVYDTKSTIDLNFDFWKNICLLSNKNICIAFENDVVEVNNHLCRLEPSVNIINMFVDKLKPFGKVGICYDIGHANIANRNIFKDLLQIKDNLICLHLHNNFGDNINEERVWKNDTHNPCYDGVIDIKKFLAYLNSLNIDIEDYIIESVYRDIDTKLLEESINKDYEYIKNNI